MSKRRNKSTLKSRFDKISCLRLFLKALVRFASLSLCYQDTNTRSCTKGNWDYYLCITCNEEHLLVDLAVVGRVLCVDIEKPLSVEWRPADKEANHHSNYNEEEGVYVQTKRKQTSVNNITKTFAYNAITLSLATSYWSSGTYRLSLSLSQRVMVGIDIKYLFRLSS